MHNPITNISPSISVVIPLYNKMRYVARALDSILAQTVQDFEIIVVNDGSTDGGETIVARYTDPRIHLINQKNQGVSVARNRGVKEAHAEMVAFLDADDEWLPNFLEIIMKLRAKYPTAGLYGTGSKSISEINITYNSWNIFENDGLITSYFREQMKCVHKPILITSGLAIPKEIFLDVGGFPINFQYSEDRCLIGMIALKYHTAYSPKICVNYYLGTDNNSSKITTYVEDPFSLYMLSLSEIVKKEIEDWDAIKEYMDAGLISRVAMNMRNHQPKDRILNDLSQIQSNKYRLKKYIYKLRLIFY